MKIYEGIIEVTEDNRKKWEAKLKDYEIIGDVRAYPNARISLPKVTRTGDVIAYSNARISLPKIQTVQGYITLNTYLPVLERRLYYYNPRKRFNVNEKCSEWLLSRKGDFHYYIDSIEFNKVVFDKIRKGLLSAIEVFQIENVEQRRIAFNRMDKMKMKQLPNFQILDEVQDDGYGYPMKIFSFKTEQYNTPFYFLNCFCPSTGREYMVETRQQTCQGAKSMSFGEDKIKFDVEV